MPLTSVNRNTKGNKRYPWQSKSKRCHTASQSLHIQCKKGRPDLVTRKIKNSAECDRYGFRLTNSILGIFTNFLHALSLSPQRRCGLLVLAFS
jgi:hypothetical protein